MTENDLSKEVVRRLVYSYKDTGITDELYSFGKMLLSETEERAKQIDSKSTAVLGWATAIVVFLFTQLTKASGVLNLSFGLASGFFGLLAVGCAYAALRPRHGWLWPSDRDWFEQTAFGSADELKRFHIRAIHEARQAQRDVDEEKSRHLLRGEKCLVIAAVLLAAGIGLRLLTTAFPSTFLGFGERIRVCIRHL